MDHERYPYYFSDPASQPKELGLGEALVALGKGVRSLFTRATNHTPAGQPKAAR